MTDEQEIQVPVEGQPAAVEKAYVTGTFNKTADAEFLRRYGLVRNVGNFSASDVIKAGVEACWNSKEMKEAAKSLKGL
jgi:hypothetical protein